MRVLLAYAPHRDTFGYSMPPPGLLRLGGELRRRGVEVVLEDLAYRLAAGELPADDGLAEAAAELLMRHGTDVVGLSTMGATLPVALAIAQGLRARRADLCLLLGGPGTTGLDRAVLERFPAIDMVVRGEGEQTLPELLGRLAEGRDLAGVTGVTWRDGAGEVRREPDRPPLADLGSLADCAWDLLPPLTAYKALTGEREGLTPIDSGRGCVYDCSFCTIGRFWGRRSRTLPVERLVDEVAALRAMPGAKQAYLCHDIFGADRRHALAFCERMVACDVRVPWECRARVDHLDAELLAAMGRAGCYRVLLGIESADARVRERCDKRLDPCFDVLGAVEACAREGITPILSLILGLPGEDEPALAASLELCAAASLRAGVNLSLHLVNPQPGCALGEEFGDEARPIEGIPPDMALGAGLTAPERELIAAHPDLFTTWALLPWGEPRLRELADIAAELPPVLMRFPKTFALLGRALGAADALALHRTWRADGRGFEGFALEAGGALVHAALRWEQALVRVAARGPLVLASPCGVDDGRAIPRVVVECIELERDAPRAVAALIAEGAPPRADDPRLAGPVWLALRATHTGVRSTRISTDVAGVLEFVAGPACRGRTLGELEREHPGLTAVLRQLAAADLLAFERATPAEPLPSAGASPPSPGLKP